MLIDILDGSNCRIDFFALTCSPENQQKIIGTHTHTHTPPCKEREEQKKNTIRETFNISFGPLLVDKYSRISCLCSQINYCSRYVFLSSAYLSLSLSMCCSVVVCSFFSEKFARGTNYLNYSES